MNKVKLWVTAGMMVVMTAAFLSGCQNTERSAAETTAEESPASQESVFTADETAEQAVEETDNATINETANVSELTVRFGDDGEPFTMYLYDNATAAAIAEHVGQSAWRLPIYHYDDYDNWEVMQYYDIPSRYEIPDNPEAVTSVEAGSVYYSEPNRIILFYHNAEISGEYTPVGYFDATDAFVEAVETNPVLEGWDTKMVNIER